MSYYTNVEGLIILEWDSYNDSFIDSSWLEETFGKVISMYKIRKYMKNKLGVDAYKTILPSGQERSLEYWYRFEPNDQHVEILFHGTLRGFYPDEVDTKIKPYLKNVLGNLKEQEINILEFEFNVECGEDTWFRFIQNEYTLLTIGMGEPKEE